MKELIKIVEKTMSSYDKTQIQKLIVEKLFYHLTKEDLEIESEAEFLEMLYKIAEIVEIEFNWGELDL